MAHRTGTVDRAAHAPAARPSWCETHEGARPLSFLCWAVGGQVPYFAFSIALSTSFAPRA
jgi:hypothetical protein